ncbi:MAG: hypothetical protein JXR83_07490 [Deltaproteobacteria bacterium]|nr:hypothetical protein [Deltaproteobacteria bacterium]
MGQQITRQRQLRHRRTAARAALAAVGWLALVAACGPPPAAGAPWLTDLQYQGQAPKNPLVLLFGFKFEDSEGDIGGGLLRPLVNGRETGDEPLAMMDVMLASGVDLQATSGALRFELEVDMDLDPATRPKAGSTFDIGIEVVDAAGQVSNHPSVTLKIDYR